MKGTGSIGTNVVDWGTMSSQSGTKGEEYPEKVCDNGHNRENANSENLEEPTQKRNESSVQNSIFLELRFVHAHIRACILVSLIL